MLIIIYSEYINNNIREVKKICKIHAKNVQTILVILWCFLEIKI